MSVTIDDLAIYLRQFFAEKLPVGGAGGAGTVVLVFDGLGRPMPASEFIGSGAPEIRDVLAHQRAAQLADQLPAANALTSGSYLARAGSRLSRLYESILVSAVAAGHDEATLHSFDAGKSQALASLTNNKMFVVSGSTAGGTSGTAPAPATHDYYYATGMSPTDWYMPDSEYWQTYELDASTPTTQTSGTSDLVLLRDFNYQVATPPVLELLIEENPTGPSPCPVEIDQIGLSAIEIGLPDEEKWTTTGAPDVVTTQPDELTTQPDEVTTPDQITDGLVEITDDAQVVTGTVNFDALARRAGFENAMMRSAAKEDPLFYRNLLPQLLPDSALEDVITFSGSRGHVAMADAARAHARLAEAVEVRPPATASTDFSVPQVLAGATQQVPAEAENMHASFEYCLVEFDRPWWDELFVGRRWWMIPGYDKGGFSSGSAKRPTDPITLLTIGMLVVRKLELRAVWNNANRAALSRSVSIGPFSLAGSSFDSSKGEISNKGMQVVAWLCQVPPELPPSQLSTA